MSFSFDHTTQITRVSKLSRRILHLLVGYKQRFRFTYSRINATSLCFQIDTFMGAASVMGATVRSVLDNIHEFKTDLEMPPIRWSMIAIPDPSSLFHHPRYLTNYPVWDSNIGSYEC